MIATMRLSSSSSVSVLVTRGVAFTRIAVLLGLAMAGATPVWALVSDSTTRDVAQHLSMLDPWMPAFLALWLVLGAWTWRWSTQAARGKRQLRQQLGADAPVGVEPSAWPLLVAALCAVLLALLSWALVDAGHAGHAWVLGVDAAAQRWSQTHITDAERAFLRGLTDTGDVLWLGVLSVLVAVLLLLRKQWLVLQVWVFAVGLNGLGTRVLKNMFDRPRPVALHALVTSGASFPSGHTAGSIVVYGLLWYVLRQRLAKPWRIALGVFFAALVGLISASRIWLEAHFASDVAAGALLGVLIWCLAVYALERGRAQN